MFFLSVKIFIQPGCPKCPKAKILGKKLEEKGFKVEYIDVKENPESAAKYLLLATPSIIVEENGNVKKTWAGTTPALEEIEKIL